MINAVLPQGADVPHRQKWPRKRATICQVLHSLCVGGAEVLAARLVGRLRDRYRFVFLCLDELGLLGEELQAEGFPIHLVGRKPGMDWACPWRVSSVMRREEVDLIHAHQYAPFFYSLASRLFYSRPPMVFTEHGRAHPDWRRWKRVAANRLLLKSRDRAVSVGEAIRRALIEYEGIPADRVGVIHNGIDLSPFAQECEDRALVRQELGAGAHERVVIQVARLDYLKDHATAIRTMAHLVKRRRDIRLFLVGEGPMRKGIEELIDRYKLASFVRLLGLRRDIPRLLMAADCFLLTSISEGIPLTVIEAMAAGLPVVSTGVGGVPEIIEHGVTGLLAPAGQDAALADHLLRVVGDIDLQRGVARLGRQRAHQVFSEDSMLDAYVELYEDVLIRSRCR